MICLGFKGGIGTASRKLTDRDGGYTVGALVQCNFGQRRLLRIAGVPVGQEITEPRDCYEGPRAGLRPRGRALPGRRRRMRIRARIIVVVATDAPLLPHQLRRVARRAALGIGRMGGIASSSSGDLFIAFSTASVGTARRPWRTSGRNAGRRTDRLRCTRPRCRRPRRRSSTPCWQRRRCEGPTTTSCPALPHDRLREVLRKYGRLTQR